MGLDRSFEGTALTIPRLVVQREVVAGTVTELSHQTIRHLRALRLRTGDDLVLTDGDGQQRMARLAELSAKAARVELVEGQLQNNEGDLAITLGVALLKQDKLDWVVEKTTELGVARIVLIRTARSEGSDKPARIERLRRIASAATEQSQRNRIPTVEEPRAFRDVVESIARDTTKLILHESATGDRPSRIEKPPANGVMLLTGPEGGFSAEEVHIATTAGWHSIRLGPRILRAETAAVSAVAYAQTRWGDFR